MNSTKVLIKNIHGYVGRILLNNEK